MRLLLSRRIRRDRVPRPPHVEVEVRFRLTDAADAVDKLSTAGVRLGKPALQDDQAYAPEDWDYSQSRLGVTFARLRTSERRHLFTVKRPLTDVRTCIEHECFVSDSQAMHEAILLMGFAPTVRIRKRRAQGQLGVLTFCLDEVEGVGHFLEVERLASAADDTDAVRREIEALLEQIGIGAERCYETYDALLYARRQERDASDIPQIVAA